MTVVAAPEPGAGRWSRKFAGPVMVFAPAGHWTVPMDLLRDVLVTLTVVTTGLSAGVLAGFGYAVIPGLTRAGADVAVELSGGIRDDESLDAAMATGCRRVNIGTAALERPEWCAQAIERYGDRVAVGLDVRGRTLAARGWTRDGGDLYETLARLDEQGCARYVVTDVNKDGMLAGPNLQLLRDVCAATDRPVVASGGVTTLDDIRALMGLVPDGVEGAIAGTALYTGQFTLEDALELTRGTR